MTVSLVFHLQKSFQAKFRFKPVMIWVTYCFIGGRVSSVTCLRTLHKRSFIYSFISFFSILYSFTSFFFFASFANPDFTVFFFCFGTIINTATCPPYIFLFECCQAFAHFIIRFEMKQQNYVSN